MNGRHQERRCRHKAWWRILRGGAPLTSLHGCCFVRGFIVPCERSFLYTANYKSFVICSDSWSFALAWSIQEGMKRNEPLAMFQPQNLKPSTDEGHVSLPRRPRQPRFCDFFIAAANDERRPRSIGVVGPRLRLSEEIVVNSEELIFALYQLLSFTKDKQPCPRLRKATKRERLTRTFTERRQSFEACS